MRMMPEVQNPESGIRNLKSGTPSRERKAVKRVGFVLLLVLTGCQARTPPAPQGPASPRGWDVRYNAALSLARRGSDKIREPVPWESLREMLDEQQQMRNFATARPDGRLIPDETAARLTVIAALRAVQDLHRRQPNMNLSDLTEPIARLADSPSLPVRTEAKATLLALEGR